MSKKRIKVSIKTKEKEKAIETNAILEDEKIKYKENKETTVIWDYQKKTLYRETKELRLRYPLIENEITEGFIKLKEYPQEWKIKVKTKRLERKNNNIKIELEVNEDTISYCIEEIL